MNIKTKHMLVEILVRNRLREHFQRYIYIARSPGGPSTYSINVSKAFKQNLEQVHDIQANFIRKLRHNRIGLGKEGPVAMIL